MKRSVARLPLMKLQPWRLLAGLVAALAILAGIGGGSTTPTSAATFIYDFPAVARVDAHEVEDAEVSPAQLRTAPEVSASPSVETRGTSTTLVGPSDATNTGRAALKLADDVTTQVDDAIARASQGKVRFPGHDGKLYLNRDGLLPARGDYTEWTAAASGAKRGADRVIIAGNPASPDAIYYWDHVNPPVQIGP